jgi:hypothetical protein
VGFCNDILWLREKERNDCIAIALIEARILLRTLIEAGAARLMIDYQHSLTPHKFVRSERQVVQARHKQHCQADGQQASEELEEIESHLSMMEPPLNHQLSLFRSHRLTSSPAWVSLTWEMVTCLARLGFGRGFTRDAHSLTMRNSKMV